MIPLAYRGMGSLVSAGDFIDLFWKIRNKGFSTLYSLFHLSNQARTTRKWNTISSTSDFWIIPEVRRRWNEKCTGDPALEYEDYLVSKYFSGSAGLKMLSVGCGTGARERKFARYPNFSLIEGIDLAENLVKEARVGAAKPGLENIKYHVGDFEKHRFDSGNYDLILFNSSLHHFDHIHSLIREKILPILKKDGFLIIFEFVGPARLQWTKQQLDFTNRILHSLPENYKIRYGSKLAKRKVYRPGLLRMMLVDPSEAIDSETIIPAIHKHFRILEEKKVGWDITHLLFKDIAHNFLNNREDTKSVISFIFEQEERYLAETGRSDAVFGVYQKKE